MPRDRVVEKSDGTGGAGSEQLNSQAKAHELPKGDGRASRKNPNDGRAGDADPDSGVAWAESAHADASANAVALREHRAGVGGARRERGYVHAPRCRADARAHAARQDAAQAEAHQQSREQQLKRPAHGAERARQQRR